MPASFQDLRRKFLKKRLEVIKQANNLFEKFVKKLSSALSNHASIILFGSRARRTSGSASDFDLLIIHDGIPRETLEELIFKYHPRSIPLDILFLETSEVDFHSEIFKKMIRDAKLLHDGLNISLLLNEVLDNGGERSSR